MKVPTEWNDAQQKQDKKEGKERINHLNVQIGRIILAPATEYFGEESSTTLNGK